MKSIFNLSALTILSSLFFGLFNNFNSTEKIQTDVDIYQMIDEDLEAQFPNIAKADMISNSTTTNKYLIADFAVDLKTTPWYNNENKLIGVSISGSGTGVDQNLEEVSTAFITKIDFESGKKWGSQMIVAPNNYSVKYRHTHYMDSHGEENIDQMLFAGMNSIETRGELEGQGSSAIRYGDYQHSISNYTQLLSHEQLNGNISIHAYIN